MTGDTETSQSRKENDTDAVPVGATSAQGQKRKLPESNSKASAQITKEYIDLTGAQESSTRITEDEWREKVGLPKIKRLGSSSATSNNITSGATTTTASFPLQCQPNTRPLTVSSAPYTRPPKDHVALKVFDVAINPIDWILQDSDIFKLEYPTVFGSDAAGEGVDDLRLGQRVTRKSFLSNFTPPVRRLPNHSIAFSSSEAEVPPSDPAPFSSPKASGATVITTRSPKNFDYVKKIRRG
ncbi:hypothetical protein CERZMDRAFT_95700 [Cercospora zeae-maydis SCOH1-5]|uniref:Uncharacterized protein n=1 Tax=Cercospora zeae-maydis SCOH1-5 TaxID=717836 RepID=A0A6A6FLV6_9PEZI|nr:hypothetical protein CERZMDRAFT_95700 [Cercospora zeae-maydis SCOH1-5]